MHLEEGGVDLRKVSFRKKTVYKCTWKKNLILQSSWMSDTFQRIHCKISHEKKYRNSNVLFKKRGPVSVSNKIYIMTLYVFKNNHVVIITHFIMQWSLKKTVHQWNNWWQKNIWFYIFINAYMCFLGDLAD